MTGTNIKLILGVVAAFLVIGGLAYLNNQKTAGPKGPAAATEEPDLTIKLTSKAGMGSYLVDDKGMTLYYFPKDTINKSNCLVGGCLTAWPIFYAEKISVPDELRAEDFSVITREDGEKQTTYLGWPLYYYFKDIRAGDTFGEGVGNVWYIAPEPFYTVMLANKEAIGNYLVDPQAMALYYFTNDRQGVQAVRPLSNCSGQCLVNWPAFWANEIIAPSLLKKTDFGEIDRTEGGKQLTYKGWPLYYYIGDINPGDTKGDGLNGVWFLAKP